jgi:photosystem II stability/assembly factor-like uncharacterized protein
MRSLARRFALMVLVLGLLGLGGVDAFAAGRHDDKDTKDNKDAKEAKGAKGAGGLDPALWKPLEWRELGPYRGGRCAAVTGLANDRSTYYFGATGGGVWKTTDAGKTWKNVSDGFFGGSIGSVAVSDWDPNVIYVGGGEETIRGNVSPGDGVWKSTDAGRTWQHMGLEDSQHIPRIRIHPKNPDLVYAAVLGHAFGPNETRGVYRSRDGGAHWERILFVNNQTGAVDLAMDPTNPRILYASFWHMIRTPYSMESGGPGSGLWKSTDGGDHWTDLTRNPGLPKGTLGIVTVTVSPTNPDNLYSIVEAEDGGVFRSRDAGKTWTKAYDGRDLRQRAWYYSRIYADPGSEEGVYATNVRFHRSQDGGKTWTGIRTPHGDNHDLWIDPRDPLRMIESNDGGANVSNDGGKTWSSQDNQPTAQIYRVSTDNHFPYRVLGAQQDNTTVRMPSLPIEFNDQRGFEVTAGGESGFVVADPKNPEVVYGGSYGGLLIRLDHAKSQVRDLNVWPDDPMGWGAADIQYRFQWNYPILFSPHDPKKLYAAANVLFQSTDEGQSWQAISPDLTRNDKSKQGPSGGPITKDNTSIEYYDTIFAVMESPLEPGVLWAGSDDGLIHLSRDGGKSWTDVTPKGMPEWSMINSLEGSPFDKGTVYVAATRYKLDDFHPYLWKTTDYGATWSRIDSGIPAGHFTRVVRADPGRRGLLFAGTERGLYASFDDGGHWQPFQLNLPIVPVTDLTVHDDDLVAATQGRGFWLLSLPTVRQLPNDLASLRPQSPVLFQPPPAYRLGFSGFNPGEVPIGGLVMQYYLDKAPTEQVAKEAKLEILGHDGKVIRTFHGKPPLTPAEKAEAEKNKDKDQEAAKKPAAPPAGGPTATLKKASGEKGGELTTEGGPGEEPAKPAATPGKDEKKSKKDKNDDLEPEKFPLEAGLNRFVWDLRQPPGQTFPGLILWSGDVTQPQLPAGDYQVRLTVGGVTRTVPARIVADPRSTSTPADLQAQYDVLMEIRTRLDRAHDAIRRIRDLRSQLDGLRQRLEDQDVDHQDVLDAAKALDEKMTKVEEALYQTKNKSPQDPLNYPVRLNDKLNSLAASIGTGDYPPTSQQIRVKDELVKAVDAQLAQLDEIFAKDVPSFNATAGKAGVPAVILSPTRLK